MNNKKLFLSLLLLFFFELASAHYMWIETPSKGKIGKGHKVQVYFGEYTYSLTEKPNEERFKAVEKFNVWVIAPSGLKLPVTLKATELFYEGTFIPKESGTYTVVMNNNEIDVIDYTQYNFGIFKTHYHATAKVVVGENQSTKIENPNGLSIKQLTNNADETVLEISYKGSLLTENEVTVFISDLWSKKLETDKDGQVKFKLPWNTKYIIEVTKNEEVPGIYNGKEYGFIWHCATFCIPQVN